MALKIKKCTYVDENVVPVHCSWVMQNCDKFTDNTFSYRYSKRRGLKGNIFLKNKGKIVVVLVIVDKGSLLHFF